MDYRTLMDKAIEASKNAYCPYSKFPVGACVLTDNDKVYTGCNFENSSFGLPNPTHEDFSQAARLFSCFRG